MRKNNPGYSVLEVLTVIALTMVGSSVAVVQLKSSKNVQDANVAASTVMEQLQHAREIAVGENRNVRISFVNSSQIQVERIETDGRSTVLSTASLPAGYTFGMPTGVHSDTPDGYGNKAPVYFHAANNAIFLGEGALTNDAGTVISGSVFTIGPGGNNTARAVTISGATGRTRQYYVHGKSWVERK